MSIDDNKKKVLKLKIKKTIVTPEENEAKKINTQTPSSSDDNTPPLKVNDQSSALTEQNNSTGQERRPYNRDNDTGQERRPYYNRDNNTGQERRPYNRDNNTGQERRPYNRDNNTGQERRPYNRDNNTGQERRPYYNRDNNTGQERRPYYNRDNNTGQERQPYNRDNNTGQERQPYNRDNNTGQERRPYNRDNNTGQERRPYNRDNNTGQERRPYNRDNNTGQERRPYNRDNNTGQERQPYNRDNNTGQERRPYYNRDNNNTGQERRPYNRDNNTGQERRPYNRDNNNTGQERRPYNRDNTGRPGVGGAATSTTSNNNAKTISHRRDVAHKDKKFFNRNDKRYQEEIALSKLQVLGKKKRGEAVIPEEIVIGPIIKLADLAHKMNLKAAELISTLFKLGQQATINDDLDSDTAILLADEFNCRVVIKDEYEEVQIKIEEDLPENLSERPPIVTIMGHVDHGKTKLLDTIRKTNVIAHESGGITQHIGAYSVKVPQGKTITFLDTPGHAAFTAMRARGAQITDIVILVVSAEEGPKPQTLEALNHARAANVPILVAINKIDLPNANPEKIKQMLSEYGLLAEDWGGDTMYIPISAMTGEGIPKLLDAVLLQAEVMELKANPNRAGVGFVIESKMDVGRGVIATIIIKNGTVKVGDAYVSGITFGKIRALFNDKGDKEISAGPSAPIEVMGFDALPQVGDDFHIMTSEDEARSLANRRAVLKRNETIIRQKKSSMKNAMEKLQNPNLKEYKIVVKADVNGSLEAILYSLAKLKNTEVKVTVVHSGIGTVSENDIMLAQTLADSSADEAAILAFRVRVDSIAKARAENADIPIRRYSVIYDLVEHVHSVIEGMLDPEVSETKIGEAEIKEIIKITNVGKVAGSVVTEGFIRKNNVARIYREGAQIWSGSFKSLRRFKDEVTEIQSGFECGITFVNYDDFKVGDIIETYNIETSSRKLELSNEEAE